MLKRTKKYAQAGFTLIEVMVAMGLSTVVLLAVVQMMGMMSKGQQTMMQLTYEQELITLATSAVQFPQGCENTLKGTPINTGLTNLARGNIYNDMTTPVGGVAMITPGEIFGSGSGQIQVNSIQLSSPQAASVSKTQQVPGNITITYTKSGGGTSTTTRSIAIPVNVLGVNAAPGAGQAVGVCYGSAASINAVCAGFGSQVNQTTGQCQKICLGSSCRTTFTAYSCPMPGMVGESGQKDGCVNQVGMSQGGIPMCGQAPHGGACVANCGGAGMPPCP